ncbi:DUF1636 domain-containing protein [Komagataeibacter sp. FNDCR2]|uniref:DUF1636 family protein n=1 Tax=Komagataeibacter sp. FNDCR2 TaxID=2878682 RepID=UPI001E5A693C|nr:DUF1636 domain-containing protein [Komagataeibacter sp. FNDCR2]MCE2575882.1 DUF1636 domain-containing protein [Komagataeibacter sp. FNDCR2]
MSTPTQQPPAQRPPDVSPVHVHVCVTCRRGLPASDSPQGRQLHDALAALATGNPEIVVHAVNCLAMCDSGCAAVVATPGKWGWLLAGLGPEKAADLLTYIAAYATSRSGTVMPSRRPASLSDMVRGRFPASLFSGA